MKKMRMRTDPKKIKITKMMKKMKTKKTTKTKKMILLPMSDM